MPGGFTTGFCVKAVTSPAMMELLIQGFVHYLSHMWPFIYLSMVLNILLPWHRIDVAAILPRARLLSVRWRDTTQRIDAKIGRAKIGWEDLL